MQVRVTQISLRRCWTAWITFALVPTSAAAQTRGVTLHSPYGDVVIDMPQALADARGTKLPSRSDVLSLYVRYPSGEPTSDDMTKSKDVIHIIISSALPPTKTRAESIVQRALPHKPNEFTTREWLAGTDASGVRSYSALTSKGSREEDHFRIFSGNDGSLVAVQLGEERSALNCAFRRYAEALEVKYLYSKDLSFQEVDAFVLRYLNDSTKTMVMKK